MAGYVGTARPSRATRTGQTMPSKGSEFKMRLAGIAARAQLAQGGILMTRMDCAACLEPH
jgi:hypothetical protein